MVSRHLRLRPYLYAISALGMPMFVYAGYRAQWSHLGTPIPTLAIASAFLIIGELRPIPVSRGADAGDELSISSTIAVALLFITAPFIALLAQAFALTVDEARSRRAWERLPFNISQYTIAMLATRAIYSGIVGDSVFGRPGPFTARDLLAGLVSSVAFFVINNGLTGVAVAVAIRMPIRRLVIADFQSHLQTGGILLALAPVVAQALTWSVATLPLLMLPLIAVHRSTRLASLQEHAALHDELTGLPNRTSLMMRLRQACETLEQVPIAVILLDLDHFKEINDTLGHYVGDRLLVEVARRLRDAVRTGDLIARLGGDEFAIIAYHVSTEGEALDVANRLREAFQTTLPLSGADLTAQASLGVALAPQHGESDDLLLKRADVALYEAKTTRGSVMVYDGSTDTHSIERLALVADLRRGLETGEVFPLYQPQCNAITGEIVGVEALARWRHSQAGVLSPGEFLEVAESAGMLDALTDVLLAQALEALRGWHRAGHLINLSINISPRTMRDPGFVDRVREALAAASVEPRWLTIEITEYVMLTDPVGAIRELERLRRLGCRIAVDDFGTGYSSISYLKQLPIDELKIDKSFVAQLGENPKDEVIVSAVIDLGHRMGLTVTAEGVETDAAWALLSSLGCDVVQGYLLAQPLTAEAVNAWLTRRVETPDVPARARLKAL